MIRSAISLLLASCALSAQPPATPLRLRGYAVIPTPRNVLLGSSDVRFDESWGLRADGIAASHIAVRSLRGDLRAFHGLDLSANPGKLIRLEIRRGAVAAAGDPALQAQGYRLRIAAGAIDITGNGDPGLFYGVQTLLQLLKPAPDGGLQLPEATIEDWPALQLRFLHWDTKHHQDRMETLKRYLDWSARFKANMIGFELEDKFEYPSHPVIGAPGAFTAAELQEIVDYGLERFIQVVPVIQAPAHLSYVLKHPQFAHLKADGNNYQAGLCNEESYKLIFQMYDDAIRATRGVDYFFVSTDEVYFAEKDCPGAGDADQRSRQWASFARRAHDHLALRGRRMLAWLESPLLAKHLDLIPSGVIDGVIGEPEFVPIEKKKGMRQLGYVSTQGAEFLFPDHMALDPELADPPNPGADDPFEFERGASGGHIPALFQQLARGRFWQANPIGAFGAAWDDSGLHNETFWLGWSAAASWGWNPGTPGPDQHIADFMDVYYGPNVTGMAQVYRSMQRQARAWQRTWDRAVSRLRGPGYGNYDGKGIGTTRYDQTIAPPPLPSLPNLEFVPRFEPAYAGYLRQARERLGENADLLHSLHENLVRATRNRYNLEVMLALTEFIGRHWRLLLALQDAERLFGRAREAATKNDAKQAVAYLVDATNAVGRVEKEGPAAFRKLTAVFERSQYPKGRSAGGREFVQVLDDTKDHWAGRTADWSFMFLPEQSIGLGRWRAELRQTVEAYAKRHGVPIQGSSEERLEE